MVRTTWSAYAARSPPTSRGPARGTLAPWAPEEDDVAAGAVPADDQTPCRLLVSARHQVGQRTGAWRSPAGVGLADARSACVQQPAGDVAQRGVEDVGRIGLDADGAQPAPGGLTAGSSRETNPAVSNARICSPSSSPPPPEVTWSRSSGLSVGELGEVGGDPVAVERVGLDQAGGDDGAAERDVRREVADRPAGDRAERRRPRLRSSSIHW